LKIDLPDSSDIKSFRWWEEFFRDPCITRLTILGTLIGIIGGLGAVFFHYLILGIKYLFYGATSTDTFLDSVLALPWYYRLAIPAIGGLIIGPIITYLVPEAKGHGVPEVMEGVALKGGNIRGRVAPLKAFMSAICIGSGGSAGREGPIVQIGASFGSSLGQFLNFTPEDKKALLAAGAAAGIAGTFNAPLAGIIFALEVILRKIRLHNFAPIIIASIVGNAIANLFFPERGYIFDIPTLQLVSYWEVFTYLGLGLVAGLVALFYGNLLYKSEDFFEMIPFPEFIKPALGGLALGLLALYVHQVLATGYPVMTAALYDNLPFYTVLTLCFAKIFATSLTLGSGGSGGIFAPGLFIGAMLGSTYGKIVHTLFPNSTGYPSSYAIIGMGAIFAGATHAPLTAIIILFEMTGDVKIFLPLIFACIVSTVVTNHIQKRNIYTTKLLRRGVDIDSIQDTIVLEEVKVGDHMTTDVITVNENDTLLEARDIAQKHDFTHLPVIRKSSKEMVGMVRYHKIMDGITDTYEEIHVRAVMDPVEIKVTENQNMFDALKIILEHDANIVPVVSERDPDKLVGIISRNDIIDAYHKKVNTGLPSKSD